MGDITDYQKQVAKMRSWNRRMVYAALGFMLLVFFALTGYAIWSSRVDNKQTQEILNYIESAQRLGSDEAKLTRQGGDIIRCMQLITNTTEPEQRTTEQVNACYPGGSPEAWEQYRLEVLND